MSRVAEIEALADDLAANRLTVDEYTVAVMRRDDEGWCGDHRTTYLLRAGCRDCVLKARRLRRYITKPSERRVRDFARRRHGGLCIYCRLLLGSEVDHIIPASRGGSSQEGNLTLACSPCNYSKGDDLLIEWWRRQPYRRARKLGSVLP